MPISWNKTKYIWKERRQTGLGSPLLIGQLGLGYIQYLMSRMAGSGGHRMADEDILLQEVRHQPFTLRQRAIWRVFGSLPGEAKRPQMRLQEKKRGGMGERRECDNLLMHWTIANKHSRWREPMQIHCHKADPSLPATCCSQSRAPQWLSDTRMMERMVSGGSRYGFRGLWTIDHIGICWKIGYQSRLTCTLRDKDASGLSGGNQFPQILDVFCIILCKNYSFLWTWIIKLLIQSSQVKEKLHHHQPHQWAERNQLEREGLMTPRIRKTAFLFSPHSSVWSFSSKARWVGENHWLLEGVQLLRWQR